MATAVRTALTAGEALAHLAAEPAELVLADTALSRPDSAAFVRSVLAAAPGAVVVLFGPEEPRLAAAAVAAGARGVIRVDRADPVTLVTKALLLLLGQSGAGTREPVDHAGSQLPRSLTVQPNGPPAQTGGTGLSTRVAAARVASTVPQQLGDAAPELPRRRVDLTERELQVLRGMADGKSNAEIGRELFVSEDTVKTHARRLFRKLGARDRAHAVASAFRAGLVS